MPVRDREAPRAAAPTSGPRRRRKLRPRRRPRPPGGRQHHDVVREHTGARDAITRAAVGRAGRATGSSACAGRASSRGSSSPTRTSHATRPLHRRQEPPAQSLLARHGGGVRPRSRLQPVRRHRDGAPRLRDRTVRRRHRRVPRHRGRRRRSHPGLPAQARAGVRSVRWPARAGLRSRTPAVDPRDLLRREAVPRHHQPAPARSPPSAAAPAARAAVGTATATGTAAGTRTAPTCARAAPRRPARRRPNASRR